MPNAAKMHGRTTSFTTSRYNADGTKRTTAQRGYGYPWQRFRVTYLAENPWCTECRKAGSYTLAKFLDHIIPHRGRVHLLLDPENVQGLCLTHNNEKTARERKDGIQ